MNINFSMGRTVQAKPMKPWQGVLMGLIFAVVGIALLFFAVSSIKTYKEKNASFIETTSTVVDYKYNDEGLQAIVVEYVVNGQTYQKISNSYSNMPKSIGTEVSIKYNPNNPRDAIWTTDSTNFILPIFGGVFTLVGIAIVIFSIKSGQNQDALMQPTVDQENTFGGHPGMNSIDQSVSNSGMNDINDSDNIY